MLEKCECRVHRTPERNAEYIRFRKKCERRNPWQRVGVGLKVSKEDTRNFAKLLKHGMSEKRSMRLNDLSFHLSCRYHYVLTPTRRLNFKNIAMSSELVFKCSRIYSLSTFGPSSNLEKAHRR
jgi:hypothetical protein